MICELVGLFGTLSALSGVLATGVSSIVGPPPPSPLVRPLVIRAYPAIDNIQSDLYEVYQQPYSYNVMQGRALSPIEGDDSDEDSKSVSQEIGSAAAVAIIEGEGEGDVKGEVVFTQRFPPVGPVLVKGNITGLPAGKHGLHVHQAGDLRKGCEKLGGHFNPYLLQHGGPRDALRHAGDLGNVEVKDDGSAEFEFVDPLLSLAGGGRSIVGRAIVITESEDDLGRGGTADSVASGSSGKAIACGIIAYIK